VPVAGLLAYIEQVGYVLARVPAAAITIPTFPTWLGAAYYSALGPAVAAAHSSGDRRKAGLVVAGLAPAAIALTSLALWANAPPPSRRSRRDAPCTSRVSSSRSSPPSQARPATRSAPPISPCAPSPQTGGVFATSAISMSRRKPSPRRG